jgi:hypothetical protein
MARGLPLYRLMIEILTSDPAIVLFAGVGLVATGVSILRDARAQRRTAPQLSVVDDVATETMEVAA